MNVPLLLSAGLTCRLSHFSNFLQCSSQGWIAFFLNFYLCLVREGCGRPAAVMSEALWVATLLGAVALLQYNVHKRTCGWSWLRYQGMITASWYFAASNVNPTRSSSGTGYGRRSRFSYMRSRKFQSTSAALPLTGTEQYCVLSLKIHMYFLRTDLHGKT